MHVWLDSRIWCVSIRRQYSEVAAKLVVKCTRLDMIYIYILYFYFFSVGLPYSKAPAGTGKGGSVRDVPVY